MNQKLITLGIGLALALTITTLTLCPTAIAEGPSQQLLKTWTISMYNPPYGKYTCQVHLYQIMNDGVVNHDWFIWELLIQTRPGIVAYGSQWCTDKHFAKLLGGVLYEDIFDYSPTTTVGTTGEEWTDTLGVTITPDGGGATYSYSHSISYSISEVKVNDYSDIDPYMDLVMWEHEIDDFGRSSRYTYLAKPGVVVMTTMPPLPNISDPFWARFNVTWCKQESTYTARKGFTSEWYFFSPN
ncbi:MAG: hypothetical protein ACUVRA_00835 [Candidatus Bathyarchaeaceae archaeon]